MSYCLNPDCQKCQNSDEVELCQSCGSKLLLGDRYRAIKPIGTGNGRTFLAVDGKSSKLCCIAQFFPQIQSSKNAPKAVELFEKAALTLEKVGKHPQIPKLLGYFVRDDRQYLVQEFFDGQNLAQELAEEGVFSETQICQLLNDLLPVLQFLHNKKVIHRDIKPENIIRPIPTSPYQGGQLLLVDFKTAKFIDNGGMPSTETAIGSAEYIAPEQAKGYAVFASDIYSLGVVCIHLLTQIPPFDLFDVGEDKWVWRDYLNTSISDEFSQIIDKMLARDIKRRYCSADEVIADLNRQLSAIGTASLVIPSYSQRQGDRTSSNFIKKNGLKSDCTETLSSIPINVSFTTERWLLGSFVVMAILSGSLNPAIAVLAFGGLISLIFIFFSYRFQSFPEVAKKHELITNIRNHQQEIQKIENIIINLQAKKSKLADKISNLINQQLKYKQKEKHDSDKIERELQAILAEINSQQNVLNTGENQEIVHLLPDVKSQAIAAQLTQYSIDKANITGIGVEITNRLLEAGIKTAADVEYERVITIRGIGESKAANLRSWREQVEFLIIKDMPNTTSLDREADRSKNQYLLLELRTAAEKVAAEKKEAIRRNYQQQQDLLTKRLKDAKERNEYACISLEEKINKQSQNLEESRRILTLLEQTLEAYTQVNFAAYMRRILFL